jgi:hypothetical protein
MIGTNLFFVFDILNKLVVHKGNGTVGVARRNEYVDSNINELRGLDSWNKSLVARR